jgi:hypothetical protein
MSNLIPSSYEYHVFEQQYVEQKIDYDNIIRTRCPNYLHKNGKIFASGPGDPYVAVTVSPYHENFRSQIEDLVWPAIESLLNKGYLTVSCCGGHKDPWWEYYIIIAVGTEDQLKSLVSNLEKVENTKIEIFSKMANVYQYFENDKIKYRKSDELERSLVEEYKDLNILFNRNYNQYHYIKLSFNHEKFKLFFNPFNLFSSHFFHKKEINNFQEWKTNLVNSINSDQFDFFYG